MTNDSFVFYKSFYEAAAELDDADRLAFYDALATYALADEEPEIESAVVRALFKMARPQIDANEKRREAGKKGAEFGKLGGRPKKDENPIGVIEENPIGVIAETPNVNVNVNANANVNEDKKRGTRMARPTLEEVREYCKQRGNSIDAEQFIAFYDSKGWKVGGSPMKSWKAAVITWEKREKEREKERPTIKAVKQNQFTAFEDRHSYDFDSLAGILSQPVGGVL